MNLTKIFESALDYQKYRLATEKLVAEFQPTGNVETDKLIEFTKLNIQRMNRIDKTVHLSEDTIHILKQSDKSFDWLLIGDAWCGDCAQIVPVVNKVAESTDGRIRFRIISRDIFPELIETYLTNGSKSIPKLLVIDKISNEVVCTWGPRPLPAHDILLNWKANLDKITKEDFEKDLHLWYARDKGISIINELVNLMEKCEEKLLIQQ